MQRLIVQIPDNKMAFFIDLAKNLGFTVEKSASEKIVSTHTRAKGKISALRGKISPMTNEQIDQQFNNLRNEWTKSS